MARFNLEIYVPFLECPCGPASPEKDKQAEDFQQTLVKLKNKYQNEISYMVYALNLHLHHFKTKPELAVILQSQGKKGLPAIFVNDKLAFQGKYPGMEEMEKLLSPVKSSHE